MIFFSYALGGVNHTLSNVSGSGFSVDTGGLASL